MAKSKNVENETRKILNEDEKRLQRQSIKRKFILICVATVLLLCGYSACFVLQTSVNIKAGLGKTSRYLMP